MKKTGANFEFTEQRNNDLLRTYREKLRECKAIRRNEIIKQTVQSPSQRFWVSEERAAIVVKQMMAGNKLEGMHPMKKTMYEEIYRRTMDMKMNNPEMTVTDIVRIIVEQPAPCFYLNPESAIVIICKAMKRRK